MLSRNGLRIFALSAISALISYLYFETPWDPAVKAGPFRIKESAIQYQMAVNRIAIPQSTSREFAINQLTEALLYERIMEKHGFPILAAYIPAERIRIEAKTQRPELLRQIQSLKGFNQSYFEQIFVRGTLVRRLIFNQFYFSNAELHKETRTKAQEFLERFRTTEEKEIRTAAHTEGHEFFFYELSPGMGVQFTHVPAYKNSDNDSSSPQTKFQAQTQPTTESEETEARTDELKRWFSAHAALEGQTAALIDEGEQWAILFRKQHRLSDLTANGLRVVVQKRPFQEWIKTETEAALNEDYLQK